MNEHIANNARLYQADTALAKKLGNQSFDQAITPANIAAAQDVIAAAADELAGLIARDLERLQQIAVRLKLNGQTEVLLTHLINAAFAIKANAGLCGYTFGASLAQSLYIFCELDTVFGKPLNARSLAVIQSHVVGLETIFSRKISGDGGAAGIAILAELQKIAQKP